MSDRFKILRSDLEFLSKELVKSGRFEDVLYELKEQNALSMELFNIIVKEETTITNKARNLILHLSEAESNIDIFVEILVRKGLFDLASHIDPNFTATFCTRDSFNVYGENLVTLPHLPASESLPSLHLGKPQDAPHMPDSSQSCPIGLNENNMAPIDIKVIPAQTIYGHDPDDREVYKNSSFPRGLVFIANFDKFEERIYEPRHGSEVDVDNLTCLFTQMGYLVLNPHQNLTRSKFVGALRDFPEDPRFDKVDSCVVIIMSHGRDEKSFYTSDNQIMTDKEVLDSFTYTMAPKLSKKPKIFIFQYCRGTSADKGVEGNPITYNINYEIGNVNNYTDGVAMGSTRDLITTTTYSDMYSIYSTIEGYVSFRNRERGAWLIEAICHEFMDHAHDHDLDSLMKRVIRRIKAFTSENGRKQVCELRNIGFDKHFYFNPRPLPDQYSSFNNLQELGNALPNSLSSSSINSNAGSLLTPPHMRRNSHFYPISRSSTPESFFGLTHSNSGTHIRSRNSSGISNRSEKWERDPSPFSPTNENWQSVKPKGTFRGTCSYGMPQRSLSVPSFVSEARNNSYKENAASNAISISSITCPAQNNEYIKVPGDDVVDTLRYNSFAEPVLDIPNFKGTAEDFKLWRLRCHPEGAVNKHSKFKRQLSIPTENEVIKSLHHVSQYLQINDLDEYTVSIDEIKHLVKKNKNKGKKKKTETNSLEY